MKYWNYRLIRKTYRDQEWMEIQEVYYDENDLPYAYGDAGAPYGDDLDEVRRVLEKMSSALDKDILDEKTDFGVGNIEDFNDK